MSFEALGLAPALLRAVADEGYKTPTPIQQDAIPHVLAGKDLLGVAQTGTGKTAAFALPMLHRLAADRGRLFPRACRALILTPTRELAIQIDTSFQTYGRHLQLRTAVIFGGVGQQPQVNAMARGLDILTATPGRLLDLMGQGHVDLGKLSIFVLDEADRMLDMGFLPDVKRVITAIPKQRQTLFFSATMPPAIVELSHKLLTKPVHVEVTPQATTAEKVTQRVIYIDSVGKRDLLVDVLSDDRVKRALVFTRTKHGANRVVERLEQDGIPASAIHGNKSQGARQRALDGFRTGDIPVLVATDIAARGIDVDGVTHVINYDIPVDAESYVHRIGRTARAGASGMALSFCELEEVPALRDIEKLIGQKIPVASDKLGVTTGKVIPPTHKPPQQRGNRGGGGGRGNRTPRGRGHGR
jgi:ATP-dependent RNA helicase RhlE